MLTFSYQQESWPRKRKMQSNEILVLGLPTAKTSANNHGAKTIVDIAKFTVMVIARKRKEWMHPRAG
jgi:uncharacterized protein YwlG (UPF0340 family)